MALLYRFVRLPDRANSHVFTFVVTRSVTRDVERDVTSKEFTCGHQRWAITFSRTDKVLGVYLVWKSTSEFMRVYVDFAFTILNREHFSVNEGFSGKQVKFTVDCPAQGNRNYIPVSDLYTRNFTDLNGEFQLELSMGHVRTVFDTEFRLPTTVMPSFRNAAAPQVISTKIPQKLESSYFTFGGFDWNLALYPHGVKETHHGGDRGDKHSSARKGKKSHSLSPERRQPIGREKDMAEKPSTSYRVEGGQSAHSSPRKGKKHLSPERRQQPAGREAGWEPDRYRPRYRSPEGERYCERYTPSPRKTPQKKGSSTASSPDRRAQQQHPEAWDRPQEPPVPSAYQQEGEGRVSFYLQRCTGFDHQCRVRYSVSLGDGERRIDSGVVDDVSDSDGKSYGWHPRTRFSDLIFKGAVRVHLEMILANTLSEVVANIVVQQSGTAGNPMGVIAQGVSQCYDRDKLAWSIKTDSHADTVRLHMVYKEIHNVPRNHLRYVSWTAYVLRFHGKHCEPVPLPGAPFSHYYCQDVSDEGIIMETEIGMKDLCEPNCPYLSEKGQLRMQVEWEESYLLFQATYHKYDDVGKIHNQQMRSALLDSRKEITALQAENYSLERQLFSYQKSIAFAHSRGTYSDELVSPETNRVEEEEDRYYEDRAYALGDNRSVSTDTEYA